MRPSYIVIPLLVFATAAAGGMLTSASISSGWYEGIVKPPWTPPGSVIGTVWTVLFLLAALSAILAWERSAGSVLRKPIAVFFALNAVLNLGWTWIFFTLHLMGLAVFEAALLGLSVAALIILIRPVSRAGAWLLMPYLIWVAFATFLTYSVWMLNR